MASIKLNPFGLFEKPTIDRDYLYTVEEGVETRVKAEGDKVQFETFEDAAPILQANYEDRKEADPTKGHWRHVARVPLAIWLKLEALGVANDPQALKKALNMHPELKTTTKRL